jgi:predicted O-methyltransferase YrrM
VKQWLHQLSAGRHRRAALAQLHALEGKLPSARSRFALPFVFRGSGLFRKLEPRQNAHEIEQLYERVLALKPRRVLEIGTARGGTLYLWTQAAADDAVIVSVDLPGGDFGGAYPRCRMPFYREFARPGQTMHLLRADSHQPQTREQVQSLLHSAPLDFLFIDGDHTYEGVRADFEQYAPLVRPGGMVAMHDILPRQEGSTIQVHRLWQQLRGQYPTAEIVGPEGTRRIGIGVITVPADTQSGPRNTQRPPHDGSR